MTKDHTKQLATKEHRKQAFLENYPRFSMVSKTAQAIGIDRRTVYNWIREDRVFEDTFLLLKKDVEQERLEHYQEIIDSIIDDKDAPAHERLIGCMYGQKAIDRPKYEGTQVQQTFTGNIIVQSAIPKPDYVVTDNSLREYTTKLLPKGGKDSESLPMAVNDDKIHTVN